MINKNFKYMAAVLSAVICFSGCAGGSNGASENGSSANNSGSITTAVESNNPGDNGNSDADSPAGVATATDGTQATTTTEATTEVTTTTTTTEDPAAIAEREALAEAEYQKSCMNSGSSVTIAAGSDFSEFSTKEVPFGPGSNRSEETNRPTGINWYVTNYGNYAADFIQPMEGNYIYLTFDEGYEYGNTPAILDALKEKDAKAVFFVTLPFVKENPDLVQRMIDEGHVVGNHTVTHPLMNTCDVDKQHREIQQLHDYVLENFGYEMYLFRFPQGQFSEQSLAIVQSLGYRAVFWSFAHNDWDVNNQPDVKESLDNALLKAHAGAIYLLHGISTTDTKMLPDLIDGLRDAGYKIGYYYKVD